MNSISFRHHLLKIANFLQSENTKIFTEKFADKEISEVKSLADRAYSLFGIWKDYDAYRSLLSSISTWEEMESFVSKAEQSVEEVSSKVSQLGVPANVSQDMGRQYLHKYIGDLNSDIFISRVNDLKSKNEFFSLLRGEKKKADLPPELEGKDLSGLGKDYIEWIKGVLDISRAGIEVHRVEDIISLARTFRSSEMKLNKKISEFKTYSEVSNYLDENSGISKPAYIESIRELAQSGDMSKVIYDDERWTVVLIGSTVAGQWWGSDTDFCISSIENNLFNDYAVNKNIDPYFIIDKFAKSSDKMRKFTIAIKYSNDGKFEISKDRSTITNAANNSIDIVEIYSHLGEDKDKIFSAITSDAERRGESLGRQNHRTIDLKIKELDIEFIKKYKKEIGSSERLLDLLLENIKSDEYLPLIKDAFDLKVKEKEPIYFIERYSKYPILDAHLKIAAKKAFDTEPVQILSNIVGNEFENELKYYLPYLEQSIESFLTLDPKKVVPYKGEPDSRENYLFAGRKKEYGKFLYQLIHDKHAAPYLEKIIKGVIDRDPIGSVDFFNRAKPAIPYRDYLVKKVMEIDPQFFEKIDPKEFDIVYKDYYSSYRKTPTEGFISRKLKDLGRALRSLGHNEAEEILKIAKDLNNR